MKTFEIKGQKRAEITKQEVKALRLNEMVPCVLYGGEEQVHFSVPAFDFRGLVYTPEVHLVKISVDGKEYLSTLQDIQFHPVTDAINHIDFLLVQPDKPITMNIPVKMTGVSEGVRQGGKLVAKVRRLRVKGMPNDMPDFISVDITNMKIGNSVRVRDINAPGITFLDSPANVIVSVNMTRNVVAEAADKK